VTLVQNVNYVHAQPNAGDYIVTEAYTGGPYINKLSRVTPGGVKTVIFTFAAYTDPHFVAIDSGGNYIVAEAGTNVLSRITPGGVRTVIYTFAAGSNPRGVAIDSGGNYIVAEHSTNVLSRITPGGVRTVIFTFAAGTKPFGVAIDSGGNYIVTEYSTNVLSRITPLGVRTVIFTFAAGTGPSGVAIDSGGNYIVTEDYTSLLSRVTPGGVRTVVFIFTTGTSPYGIAIDFSGNYVVAELAANWLSRVTPGGVRTAISHDLAWPVGVAIVPFDFSMSNSGGITVMQGGSSSNTITVTLTVGSTQTVSFYASGLPTAAAVSFNPASGTPTFSSILTISASSATPTGVYTITVTGTGGGATHSTTFTLTVNAASSIANIINAAANSVYYIYPATAQTGGVKDPHTIYASAADWSATGLILGLSANTQNIGLDSDGLLCSTSNGQPLPGVIGTGEAVVMVSGPIVHAGVHYYEVHGAGADKAPVYFTYDSTTYYFKRSSDNMPLASMPVGQVGGSSDIFLIETFQDANGRTVLIMYGFSYLGTLAASTYFKFTIYPNLSSYTHGYYIIQWTDAASGLSHNGIPDMGDTYTLIA
jgi:streptogramin lyase